MIVDELRSIRKGSRQEPYIGLTQKSNHVITSIVPKKTRMRVSVS